MVMLIIYTSEVYQLPPEKLIFGQLLSCWDGKFCRDYVKLPGFNMPEHQLLEKRIRLELPSFIGSFIFHVPEISGRWP